MQIAIEKATTADFSALLGVWQRSVLASHDFLHPNDFATIESQLIPMYFPQVSLYKAVNVANRCILGFAGVVDQRMEMLFVDSEARGKGVGSLLLHFAIDELGINELDVNEQNQQAVDFYTRKAFICVSRSELDGAGKPYPTLTLKLK